VQGNFVGTDGGGTNAVPNGGSGVLLEGGTNFTIGGASFDNGGNLVSGNEGNGIALIHPGEGAPVTDSDVTANFVGVASDGAAPLPNGGDGVLIANSAGNFVGGDAGVDANTIANNGGDGVRVDTEGTFFDVSPATGNTISRNSISQNDGLGIDLAPADGVTPNDAPPDADTGSNGLQNYPLLHAALPVPATSVSGTLLSKPNTTYTVEFFENAACDASGNGEAEKFLASKPVTTDNVGYAIFTQSVITTLVDSAQITATATDPQGNTSELSPCREEGTEGAPQQRPPDPPQQQQPQTQTPTTQPTITPQPQPKPKCPDKLPPITTLKRGGLRGIGAKTLTLKGKARDRKKCASGVQKVQVSLARVRGRTGTNCRFIKRPSRYQLTHPQNCRRPVLFLATGRNKWTFRFPVDLKPGLYRVQARATDKAGNKETPKKRRNIVFFAVR
jgi:hypothetical protein